MFVVAILYLGYKPSRSDMYVWMNPKTNPKNGEDYYYYVLVYVDDFLHIHQGPEVFMTEFTGFYRLEDGSLGSPYQYLVVNVEKVKLVDSSVAW